MLLQFGGTTWPLPADSVNSAFPLKSGPMVMI
jgi:hypothetical protein